jgi:hypothetical protein
MKGRLPCRPVPRRRLRSLLPLALVLASVLATPATPAPPAGPALFVTPGGSDSQACTRAQPCKTLNGAYRLAKPGQVVEVGAGRYPAQTVEAKQGAPGAPIVFRAAPGASVTFESLTDHASHVVFSRLNMQLFWRVENTPVDVTFRNVNTHVFSIRSSVGVSVIGGSVGPWDSNKLAPIEDNQVGDWDRTLPQPRRILIRGVFFHDFTHAFDASAHTDCLQFTSGVDVTIEGNRFTNCDADDIYIRGDFGAIRNFLVENNFFAHTASAPFSVRLSGPTSPHPCENVLVRYNSALQRMWSDCPAAGPRGVRFSSNIISNEEEYHCSTSEAAGATWDHNVIEVGVKCGPTDLVAPVQYRNRAKLDLRLMPGSAAIGRGDPASYPAIDIFGHHRPKGRTPDAGADEVG